MYDRIFTQICLTLIAFYRIVLAPYLGGRCRFVPTCSVYAGQVLAKHGSGMGLRLIFQRLIKCHPFHASGFDPPPQQKDLNTELTPSFWPIGYRR